MNKLIMWDTEQHKEMREILLELGATTHNNKKLTNRYRNNKEEE